MTNPDLTVRINTDKKRRIKYGLRIIPHLSYTSSNIPHSSLIKYRNAFEWNTLNILQYHTKNTQRVSCDIGPCHNLSNSVQIFVIQQSQQLGYFLKISNKFHSIKYTYTNQIYIKKISVHLFLLFISRRSSFPWLCSLWSVWVGFRKKKTLTSSWLSSNCFLPSYYFHLC